jgi:hypothetical protein
MDWESITRGEYDSEYLGPGVCRDVHCVLINGIVFGAQLSAISPIPAPPVYDPFTLDTFPPLHRCELRARAGDRRIATCVYADGATVNGSIATVRYTFRDLFNLFDIRIDSGDWQPCGVKREAK